MRKEKPAYLILYEQIRTAIADNIFPTGTKLPSKRALAADYDLSLVTVEHALDLLEEEGYTVVMTREDNETAISNSERAILANESGALFSLRIHANGSENSSVEGALMLVPGENNKYIPELHDESVRIADYILTAYCESTGRAAEAIPLTETASPAPQ